MTQARYIFLSHNSTDKAELSRFADMLVNRPLAQTHNLQVWLDKTNLEHGVQYPGQFASNINHPDTCAFLLFMPGEPIRAYVEYEIGIALNRHLQDKNDGRRFPILPVYPGASSGRVELPEAIRTFNYREYVYDDPAQIDAIIADALGLNVSTPAVGASLAADSSCSDTGEQNEVWLSFVLSRAGDQLQAEDALRTVSSLACPELPAFDATSGQLLPLSLWLLGDKLQEGVSGRLRILTDDPQLAMLPWQRLPHPQTSLPLVESGWVVETGTGRNCATGFVSIAPQTPLLVIPSHHRHDIAGDKHHALAQSYLEANLDTHSLMPRIKTPQALQRELRLHQPDLLYIYARFEQGCLQLDKDLNGQDSVSLQALGEWVQEAGLYPLVIINLIGSHQGLEVFPQNLVQASRLVWIQSTFRKKKDNWVDLEKNLAQVMEQTSRDGDLVALITRQAVHAAQKMQSFLWVNGQTPHLQLVGSQQKRIRQLRAALLKVMLGRESLKSLVLNGIQKNMGQPVRMVTYAVTGDATACPHDVPEQIRQRLQWDFPERYSLPVMQFYFHISMEDDDDPLDVLDMSVSEGILHGSEDVEFILNRELERRGLHQQECCVAFNWLFRVEVGQEDAVPGWLDTWGNVMHDYFKRVRLDKAILLNAFCLQVNDEKQAQAVQVSANKELRNFRSLPGCPMQPIIYKEALGKLDADEIDEFLGSNQQYWYRELKLDVHNIDPWTFAEWVVGQTGGRFEETVNWIWKHYQRDYQEYPKP